MVPKLQQQPLLTTGQIHHGFGEPSPRKAPAKVGPDETAGAAGCCPLPEQHLPDRSLPCLHQHNAGWIKYPAFDRNKACPSPAARSSPTRKWFLIVSKTGRMEIGQTAGRYICRGAGMKGTFLRLRILEHGTLCVPAPSLAAFKDWAGKPLPGGTQAGAHLQSFLPLLPCLPHFPPPVVLGCSCPCYKSTNCPAGLTGSSGHTATWLLS